MTRRNFIGNLLVAGAAFAVLPPATTYARIWRAERQMVNPDWVNAEYEVLFHWNKSAIQFTGEPFDLPPGFTAFDLPINCQVGRSIIEIKRK